MFASITSFGYRAMVLGHLLSVLVAVAPTMVWPVLNRRRRVEGTDEAQDVRDLQGTPVPATAPAEGALTGVFSPMVHGGALVLAGAFGILAIIASDEAFTFEQTWVSIAFVLWFCMLGVVFAGLAPAQRALREGSVAAESRVAMFYGALHLLVLLQVVDMVWKPGL